MSNNKISKDIIPEGFTIPLVLVDALPVIFFAATMIIISLLFASPLFLFGAILCFYAGAAKVLWKLIVVLNKKNIWWLFMQMRIVMPIGFLLMLLALITNHSSINGGMILTSVLSMPSVIFFVIGIIGMILMIIFAFCLDSSDAKSNWIEQLTNGLAQACFFLGTLFILI